MIRKTKTFWILLAALMSGASRPCLAGDHMAVTRVTQLLPGGSGAYVVYEDTDTHYYYAVVPGSYKKTGVLKFQLGAYDSWQTLWLPDGYANASSYSVLDPNTKTAYIFLPKSSSGYTIPGDAIRVNLRTMQVEATIALPNTSISAAGIDPVRGFVYLYYNNSYSGGYLEKRQWDTLALVGTLNFPNSISHLIVNSQINMGYVQAFGSIIPIDLNTMSMGAPLSLHGLTGFTLNPANQELLTFTSTTVYRWKASDLSAIGNVALPPVFANPTFFAVTDAGTDVIALTTDAFIGTPHMVNLRLSDWSVTRDVVQTVPIPGLSRIVGDTLITGSFYSSGPYAFYALNDFSFLGNLDIPTQSAYGSIFTYQDNAYLVDTSGISRFRISDFALTDYRPISVTPGYLADPGFMVNGSGSGYLTVRNPPKLAKVDLPSMTISSMLDLQTSPPDGSFESTFPQVDNSGEYAYLVEESSRNVYVKVRLSDLSIVDRGVFPVPNSRDLAMPLFDFKRSQAHLVIGGTTVRMVSYRLPDQALLGDKTLLNAPGNFLPVGADPLGNYGILLGLTGAGTQVMQLDLASGRPLRTAVVSPSSGAEDFAVDWTRGYLYVVMSNPRQVLKVRLQDLTVTDQVAITGGADDPKSMTIDSTRNTGYLVEYSGSRIVQIDLGSGGQPLGPGFSQVTPEIAAPSSAFSPTDHIRVRMPDGWIITSYDWTITPAGDLASSVARISSPLHTVSQGPELDLAPFGLAPGSYHLNVFSINDAGLLSGTASFDFSIAAGSGSGSAEFKVYPSPWRADQDSDLPVRFAGLTAGAQVDLFTIAGHWVRSITADSSYADWPLDNQNGEQVASGIYLYVVKMPDGTRRQGKFGVIR